MTTKIEFKFLLSNILKKVPKVCKMIRENMRKHDYHRNSASKLILVHFLPEIFSQNTAKKN